MNNTALGAENKKEQTINFISEAHEKFYYEKLKEVRYQDVYHNQDFQADRKRFAEGDEDVSGTPEA